MKHLAGAEGEGTFPSPPPHSMLASVRRKQVCPASKTKKKSSQFRRCTQCVFGILSRTVSKCFVGWFWARWLEACCQELFLCADGGLKEERHSCGRKCKERDSGAFACLRACVFACVRLCVRVCVSACACVRRWAVCAWEGHLQIFASMLELTCRFHRGIVADKPDHGW